MGANTRASFLCLSLLDSLLALSGSKKKGHDWCALVFLYMWRNLYPVGVRVCAGWKKKKRWQKPIHTPNQMSSSSAAAEKMAFSVTMTMPASAAVADRGAPRRPDAGVPVGVPPCRPCTNAASTTLSPLRMTW